MKFHDTLYKLLPNKLFRTDFFKTKSEEMKLNKQGIDLMHEFEGLKLESYLCPANVWTIGYGNTFYEDGKKVKKGDKISLERANELFKNITEKSFAVPLRKLIVKPLNDNQFSALVSLAYNIGLGNFKSSTILKMVNTNPDNPFIREQFMRWNKASGKPLTGLTRRRHSEANLYFKP